MSGAGEFAGQVRVALGEAVAGHGPQVLDDRFVLGALLADLLPDSPQVARLCWPWLGSRSC
jgi:hypothetical protein